MSSGADVLVRSALAGAACGCRAFTGPAAVSLTHPAGLPPWVPKALAVLAIQELVADKLPMAPSRLQPAGLAFRFVTASACAVQLARATPVVAEPEDPDDRGIAAGGQGETPAAGSGPLAKPVVQLALGAGLAVAGAGLSAWAGSRWRATGLARHRPIAAALLEDAVAVLAAGAAARQSPRS